MKDDLVALYESLYHNRSAEYRGYMIYRSDSCFTCPALGAHAQAAKDLMNLIDEKIGR